MQKSAQSFQTVKSVLLILSTLKLEMYIELSLGNKKVEKSAMSIHFSIKQPAPSQGQRRYDMAQYVYVNIKNGSFKVWGYDAFSQDSGESEVITYWGKIGTPMQKLRKNKKQFKRWGDAYDYLMDKTKEKKCKGYKIMKNYKYFDAISSKPLSSLIQMIEALPQPW